MTITCHSLYNTPYYTVVPFTVQIFAPQPDCGFLEGKSYWSFPFHSTWHLVVTQISVSECFAIWIRLSPISTEKPFEVVNNYRRNTDHLELTKDNSLLNRLENSIKFDNASCCKAEEITVRQCYTHAGDHKMTQKATEQSAEWLHKFVCEDSASYLNF